MKQIKQMKDEKKRMDEWEKEMEDLRATKRQGGRADAARRGATSPAPRSPSSGRRAAAVLLSPEELCDQRCAWATRRPNSSAPSMWTASSSSCRSSSPSANLARGEMRLAGSREAVDAATSFLQKYGEVVSEPLSVSDEEGTPPPPARAARPPPRIPPPRIPPPRAPRRAPPPPPPGQVAAPRLCRARSLCSSARRARRSRRSREETGCALLIDKRAGTAEIVGLKSAVAAAREQVAELFQTKKRVELTLKYSAEQKGTLLFPRRSTASPTDGAQLDLGKDSDYWIRIYGPAAAVKRRRGADQRAALPRRADRAGGRRVPQVLDAVVHRSGENVRKMMQTFKVSIDSLAPPPPRAGKRWRAGGDRQVGGFSFAAEREPDALQDPRQRPRRRSRRWLETIEKEKKVEEVVHVQSVSHVGMLLGKGGTTINAIQKFQRRGARHAEEGGRGLEHPGGDAARRQDAGAQGGRGARGGAQVQG